MLPLRNTGMKKILLIQPPYTIDKAEPKGSQPPLGLAYLAAVLERDGLEVRIIDAVVEGYENELDLGDNNIRYGLDFSDLQAIAEGFAPDLIGISCLFSCQYANAVKVAEVMKTRFPTVPVVMGGAHPTVAYDEVLENRNVDFVVLGEGEYTFRDLIFALGRGESPGQISGLAYRADGELRVNRKVDFIEDIDEIPFPARHLLNMEKYFRINRPHGTTSLFTSNTMLITSRGCPARCIFCSIHGIWGRRFRARSPENVVAEIALLKQEYGVKELQFEDDNLTFDKERAKRIFGLMIDEQLDMHWTTPNGVALYRLDEELIDLMHKSGCYRVCLAIESGDEYVLHKIIKKPLKLERVRPIVREFKKRGVAVGGFFVVGFPSETKEQILKTFKFASRVGFDNVNFFIATPYKGTELYDHCEQNGLLANYSYGRLKVGNASIDTPEFSARELEKLVATEIFKFRLTQLWKPRVYERVFKRFLADPRFFLSYLSRLLARIMGLGRTYQ